MDFKVLQPVLANCSSTASIIWSFLQHRINMSANIGLKYWPNQPILMCKKKSGNLIFCIPNVYWSIHCCEIWTKCKKKHPDLNYVKSYKNNTTMKIKVFFISVFFSLFQVINWTWTSYMSIGMLKLEDAFTGSAF